MSSRGLLTLIPIQAFIITKPSSRLFATQISTFLKFRLGQRECQTEVCKQKGINPFWESVHVLKKGKSTTLHIDLIDHHTLLPNQLVGSGELKLQGVILSKNMNKYEVWLKKDEEITAKVAFEIFFEPEGQKSVPVEAPVERKSALPKPDQHEHESQEEVEFEEIKDENPPIEQSQQCKPKQQNHEKVEPSPIQQNTQKLTNTKKIKKRLIKIIQAELTFKDQNKKQPQTQSPGKNDYLALGHFPDIDKIREKDCPQIQIRELKLFYDKEKAFRNTLESEVVNLKDYFFADLIIKDSQNQMMINENQKGEVRTKNQEKVASAGCQKYNSKVYTEEQINDLLFR